MDYSTVQFAAGLLTLLLGIFYIAVPTLTTRLLFTLVGVYWLVYSITYLSARHIAYNKLLALSQAVLGSLVLIYALLSVTPSRATVWLVAIGALLQGFGSFANRVRLARERMPRVSDLILDVIFVALGIQLILVLYHPVDVVLTLSGGFVILCGLALMYFSTEKPNK